MGSTQSTWGVAQSQLTTHQPAFEENPE